MALLNIINIAAAAFYLYLFVAVRSMKVRGREHRILALAMLALFQWTISTYFVYNSNSIVSLRIIIPFACIGMFFFSALNLHFVYSFVFKRKMPTVIFGSLYALALLFSLLNFLESFTLRAEAGPGEEVALVQAIDTPLHYLWISYYTVIWLLPIYFYVQYRRRSSLRREKKQTTLLIWVIPLTLTVMLGDYYITALIPRWELPPKSPIFFIPWVGAMVYVIRRYGFLRISSCPLTEKILDSVEDLVILYDTHGQRVYRNRKARDILGGAKIRHERGHAAAVELERGEAEARIIETAVNPLLSSRDGWSADYPEKQFTLRLSPDGSLPAVPLGSAAGPNEARLPPVPQSTEGVNAQERRQAPLERENRGERLNNPLTLNLRVKPVLDRFNDPLGVLVFGTVLPSLAELLENYGLTDREVEVLDYLLAGWTIRKTARTLFITERTVKAHITSIYEKTGATNRVELANLRTSGRPIFL